MRAKTSKSKRNNQKKNKLVKQGVIKKRKVLPKNNSNGQNIKKPNIQKDDSDESDQGKDLLQMVEEDDINYLKKAITSRSYDIYNKVKISRSEDSNPKRKKVIEDDTLENEYEEQLDEDNTSKKIKILLPIKTKGGVVPQQVYEEVKDSENEEHLETGTKENSDEESNLFGATELDTSGLISATQLLAKRNEDLIKMKIHIGTLSSGLLENPEEKITNLRTLLSLINEETTELYVSLKKLLIVSLLEVFKDIVPSYEIKNMNTEDVKLKKDTLKLKKYEENLLLYYKKFLQKLEKYAMALIKKKGATRRWSDDELKLAKLSVKALCDLLVTNPYFNFSQNIAQTIVPFLNNYDKNIRKIVEDAVKTIFKEDKKEEISLKIIRIINNYLKNRSHIHVEVLNVLLVLQLKDVSLDRVKEQGMKQKKLMAHKSRILQLSKRERKRKKKLKEVENELLETKAEENRQIKQKNLTEITKIVFNIYFRILKNTNNSRVLGVCLEGLAKFAHCINLEFYVDIVNVLDNLLKEDWLEYREQLHCIQTVFAILSGQGDALNLDPLRFYNSLYKGLLSVSASTKKSDDIQILMRTLNEALIRRRKKITNKRILGFVKRLAQLSIQLTHEGTLGTLGLIKNIMQLNRSTDILLDLDPTVGEGNYQPEVDDPEYSNAASSALYELILLTHHYHPIVTKFAKNICSDVPFSGDGNLTGEYGKSTPEQLCMEFDISQMAFNPSVPPPKKDEPRRKSNRILFTDSSFKVECRDILRRSTKELFLIDY